MTDWSPALLRHFCSPVGGGLLSDDATEFGTGEAGAVKSGVRIVYQLALSDGDIIDRVGWLAFGCPATIASCSWLAERLIGLSVDRARDLTGGQVMVALDIPRDRRSRVLVVEDAVRGALDAATTMRDK